MTKLLWLNEDALRDTHPVFEAVSADTHAIFIWDEAYFKKMDYGFKKLVFIYETLCELPVEIIQGESIAVITALKPSEIIVPYTPNPHLKHVFNRLSDSYEVNIMKDAPFTEVKKLLEWKRFFAYWKKVEKQLLAPK